MIKCTNCDGSGIVIKGNVAYKCSCTKQRVIEMKYKESRLPAKLQQHTFDKFELRYYPEDEYPDKNKAATYREIAINTLEAAKNFAKRNSVKAEGKGLFFCGNVGSGKTFLSSAIANYLLSKGQRVLFLVVPDLLDEIKASYNKEPETSEIELLQHARNIPVLILDDLGAHNYTDWTRNKIYSILNSRLNNELPTVINSNLTLEEIEEQLGERITSRIVELCDIYRLLVPKDIRHLKNLERRV
ncbi:MAG TPA: AAA family ATPase [Peptococcaceae bacterium]|nr:MAG: DNA replication protein [Clostridia bacterium 41_269]HBT19997.1 AAA family ATPase [Peptococcaceae bacterium]